jgi:hypothetical protein
MESLVLVNVSEQSGGNVGMIWKCFVVIDCCWLGDGGDDGYYL